MEATVYMQKHADVYSTKWHVKASPQYTLGGGEKMGPAAKRVKLTAATIVVVAMSTSMVAFASKNTAPSQSTVHTSSSITLHGPSANTPIQHVVVILGENVSFDHYFGTYPNATNPAGEPSFHALPSTPSVNGLTANLLTNNPNLANPALLDRSQAQTDDMDHDYTAEQKAFDGGLMDKFVQNTGAGSWPNKGQSPNVVMDYFDGNTVTALWNYAQHDAMSDNSFGTTFGPSTPGALNLVSGQTHGAVAYSGNATTPGVTQRQADSTGMVIPGKLDTNNTLYSDADPYFDKTSKGNTIEMTGQNVGDLLNAKDVTWGWFEGGFKTAGTHSDVGGVSNPDYIPHHEPFQYYKSTANPNHLPPTSVAMIGHQDQANHQYGMTDFWAATDAGNMPSVSFLKAPAYQDGHAGYSDPLDEQHFLTDTINHLESLPTWSSTAVILSYDDSDGWYDHAMGPIVNASNDPLADALVGPGNAGTPATGAYLDRAGYGPRLPLLVISPYAKHNFVDHSVTDQTSILRFIEDNWNLGRIGDQSYDAKAGSLTNMFDFANGPKNNKLFLNTTTGEPIAQASAPFQRGGNLFMGAADFTQSIAVNFAQIQHGITFTYGQHQVYIPFAGHLATMDGAQLDLGANVVTVKGALFIPVDSLAKALGLVPSVTGNTVVFAPQA